MRLYIKLYIKVNDNGKRRIWSNFLRVKYKYQFVIKLKANNCYQELLHYLSFFVILPNIRLLCLAPAPWLVPNLGYWNTILWPFNFCNSAMSNVTSCLISLILPAVILMFFCLIRFVLGNFFYFWYCSCNYFLSSSKQNHK